jgi:hypothetical protein
MRSMRDDNYECMINVKMSFIVNICSLLFI